MTQVISKRESIVQTLTETIATAFEGENIKVYRNLDKPIHIPPGRMIIIRDNEAAREVEASLSPLSYTYELTVFLEVMVQHKEVTIRHNMLDVLLMDICKVININRTLDNLAEWVEAKSAEFMDEPMEGAATVRSAVMPIVVRFI